VIRFSRSATFRAAYRCRAAAGSKVLLASGQCVQLSERLPMRAAVVAATLLLRGGR